MYTPILSSFPLPHPSPPPYSLGWRGRRPRGEHPYSQHPPPFWVGGRGRVPPRGGERVGGGSYSISRLFRTGSTDNGIPVGAAWPHRGNVGRSVRCQTAAEEETIPSEAICHELYVLCARGDLVCFRRSWTQKQKQKQNSMVPLEPRGRTVEMLVDL